MGYLSSFQIRGVRTIFVDPVLSDLSEKNHGVYHLGDNIVSKVYFNMGTTTTKNVFMSSSVLLAIFVIQKFFSTRSNKYLRICSLLYKCRQVHSLLRQFVFGFGFSGIYCATV